LAVQAYLWFLNNRGLPELLAEQAGQRVAIGSIAVFLLLGLLILLGVKDPTEEYIKS
jgi:hypothetical protein